MSIFVGLRLDVDSTNALHDWFRSLNSLQRPIHRDWICIPLALNGGARMDGFRGHGKMNQQITFQRRQTRKLGDRGTVVVSFHDNWVHDRIEELQEIGFKDRSSTGKPLCRIPISIHTSFMDHAWHRTFPFETATVVEEFCIPFDNQIGKKAHLPMDDQIKWIHQKMNL